MSIPPTRLQIVLKRVLVVFRRKNNFFAENCNVPE
jgi:hypothetical protein